MNKPQPKPIAPGDELMQGQSESQRALWAESKRHARAAQRKAFMQQQPTKSKP